MKLTAILIDNEEKSLGELYKKINAYCPQVKVFAKANSIQNARELIKSQLPDLMFIEIDSPKENTFDFLNELSDLDLETIIVTNLKDFAVDAFKYEISGYLLKPVHISNLVRAVNKAQRSVHKKENFKKNKNLLYKVLNRSGGNELIGIPTIKGLDFIFVNEIIRCEGLQKCTRIVTKSKSNIVSSYNLGEFRKMLETYGFFSSHKSHLINLSYVKQYAREGFIIMTDDSSVPISRRRKQDFLNCIPYLKGGKTNN